MAISRCPGQDRRYWKSEDVADVSCLYCGGFMEFWKNEARRRCPHCGKPVLNPNLDLGCAKWCKQAAECLGIDPAGDPNNSLCESLIAEMKRVFGSDAKRIAHALEVLRYAEFLLESEPADPQVVKAAAILHDIGIQEAQRKHGSNSGRFQEIEGPPIAKEILERYPVDAARIAQVLAIIASHHSVGEADTPEFRIIWDADRLANLDEECPSKDPAERQAWIRRMCRTQTGRDMVTESGR